MFYTGVLVCTNKDYVSIRNRIINYCNHLDRMTFLDLIKTVSFSELDPSDMTPTQKFLYLYFKTGTPTMDIPSYSKNVSSISINGTDVVFNNDTNTIFVSTQTNEPTLDSGFQNFILTLIDDISWPTRTGRNKTIKGVHFVTVEDNQFDTILLEGINPPSITNYFYLDNRLSALEDATTQPPEVIPEEIEESEDLSEVPTPESLPSNQITSFPLAREVHNITVHPNTL